MIAIVQVLALTLLLFTAQAVLRSASRWVVWGLFAAVPAILLPYWAVINQFDPFVWIKLYTIFACNSWGTMVRFTRLGEHEWARRSIPILVGVNIVEAVTVDLTAGGLTHLLNAVAGMGLVFTLPYQRNAVQVDHTGSYRDLRTPTSRGWVVGYTLWNWAFVLLNYPALAGHHAAVLTAALVVGLIDPARWTQARGATLGLNLLAMATFDAPMRAWLNTSDWADPSLTLAVASAAVIVAIGCGIASFFGRVQIAASTVANSLSRTWIGVYRRLVRHSCIHGIPLDTRPQELSA